jgi:pyruvate formate lyase activating enzyme
MSRAAACGICPHDCRLLPGERGLCRMRVGAGRQVVPAPDQGIVAAAVGTVEQHPLFHFYPGSRVLSLGWLGCTAACAGCLNWELAAGRAPAACQQIVAVQPDAQQVIAAARTRGCRGIAFTHNEPVVWLEQVGAVARAAKAAGLWVILVTNGYITVKALESVLPWLDAVKIDLKAGTDADYLRLAGIDGAPVLAALARLAGGHVWLELSTVVGSGMNADAPAIRQLAGTIAAIAGTSVPWHLLRFLPAHRLAALPPGSLSGLRNARAEAVAAGLRYVYISNVPGLAERDTACPACGAVLARRGLDYVQPLPAHCPACGEPQPGRGLADPAQGG